MPDQSTVNKEFQIVGFEVQSSNASIYLGLITYFNKLDANHEDIPEYFLSQIKYRLDIQRRSKHCLTIEI